MSSAGNYFHTVESVYSKALILSIKKLLSLTSGTLISYLLGSCGPYG